MCPYLLFYIQSQAKGVTEDGLMVWEAVECLYLLQIEVNEFSETSVQEKRKYISVLTTTFLHQQRVALCFHMVGYVSFCEWFAVLFDCSTISSSGSQL